MQTIMNYMPKAVQLGINKLGEVKFRGVKIFKPVGWQKKEFVDATGAAAVVFSVYTVAVLCFSCTPPAYATFLVLHSLSWFVCYETAVPATLVLPLITGVGLAYTAVTALLYAEPVFMF